LYEHLSELKKQSDDNSAIKVETEAPIDYGNTIENLKAAMAGENYEYTSMYPEFAQVAAEEGLSGIAIRLRSIAKAEEHHYERYDKLLKEIEGYTVFKKDKEIWWVCRECGYIHFGQEPPKQCPSCGHAQSYFQVKCEEY
jgi:rubrerythrin